MPRSPAILASSRPISAPRIEATMKPFLEIADLHAWYGESHVLHGVDGGSGGRGRQPARPQRRGAHQHAARHPGPRLPPAGLDPDRRTRDRKHGGPSDSAPRHRLLPGGTRHFRDTLGGREPGTAAAGRRGGMSVDEIYGIFPNLHERRTSPGTKLSGGEQQMLAIARILRTGAKLLLLDEISEGLAPSSFRSWRRPSVF